MRNLRFGKKIASSRNDSSAESAASTKLYRVLDFVTDPNVSFRSSHFVFTEAGEPRDEIVDYTVIEKTYGLHGECLLPPYT